MSKFEKRSQEDVEYVKCNSCTCTCRIEKLDISLTTEVLQSITILETVMILRKVLDN